jgi:hypothetical protein
MPLSKASHQSASAGHIIRYIICNNELYQNILDCIVSDNTVAVCVV